MSKRFLCAAFMVLLCCALAAALPRRSHAGDMPETSIPEMADPWDHVIAYVPLDDRTDNLENVIYLAEAAGYQIVLPPERDSYRSALDGQPCNANGTRYGDREALFDWVREMDEKGCDRFLLSLDQLFSGGLVNSRSMTEGRPLSFSDGSIMSETEAFDARILSLLEDGENRIYLFDSVIRLASTVGYNGFGIEEYYALRKYGMAARPVLSDDELTLENIFAAYPYAADGATPAEDLPENSGYRHLLTEEVLRDYRSARERKLRLTDHVIRALNECGSDRIRLLIGIDDSSNTENIQYNELRYIEKRLDGNIQLLAGLDGLARLLVARIAQDDCGMTIKAAVRWFGGTEDAASSEFDRYTLRETVERCLALFDMTLTGPEEAELQFLVMTAPRDAGRKAEYQEALLTALEENQRRRIPTVLIESSADAYGDRLEQALLEWIDFAQLLGFAGKYDQANVTDAGFAMGVSRYLALACRTGADDAQDIAHVRQMANSMALSYAYSLNSRHELNLYILSLGLDPNNILTGRQTDELIREKLNELFLAACAPVEENLSGGRVLSSLSPCRTEKVENVRISDACFPWGRTFEISFAVHAELAETAAMEVK